MHPLLQLLMSLLSLLLFCISIVSFVFGVNQLLLHNHKAYYRYMAFAYLSLFASLLVQALI